MKAKIRKIATFVEETNTEMGRTIDPPTRRAAAVAVIENPFAGKYVEDLSDLMTIGEELGELLTQRAVAALGIAGPTAESYGKAAAVGENGELEHAAAILDVDVELAAAELRHGAQRLIERQADAPCAGIAEEGDQQGGQQHARAGGEHDGVQRGERFLEVDL